MSPILATVIAPILSRLLDRVAPDPALKQQAEQELLRMQQAGELAADDRALQMALAQIEVNKIEAQGEGLFKSGWRPGAGWLCVAGMLYEFLLRPLLPWVVQVTNPSVAVPPLPSLDAVLFELMAGLLGLGTLRYLDKRNLARK